MEDDQQILGATVRLLQQQGHEVHAAETGAEAMAMIQSQRMDLAMVDRVLPDMDGIDICRRIKRDPKTMRTMVVLTSGIKTHRADQTEGLNAGADGHINRPISNSDLCARVDAYLRMANPGADLRRRAEALLREREHRPLPDLPQDLDALLYELDVYQVELEMQVHELRTSQRQLESARDRYFHLYHHAPVGYATLDQNGTITMSNMTLAEMLLREPTHLKDTSFSSHLALEDRPVFLGRFRAFFKAPQHKSMVLNMLRSDGSHLVVKMTGTRATSPGSESWMDPTIARMNVAITDVTAQVEAELALRASENQRLLAQRLARLGDFTWVLETLSVTWSQPLYDLLGYEVSTPLRGDDMLAMIHREDVDHFKNWIKNTPHERGGTLPLLEARILHRNGSVMHAQFRGTVERRGSCGTRISGTIQDITTQKEAEIRAARLQEQIQQAQRLESIGRLAGGVAHEINNVLGAVLARAELGLTQIDSQNPVATHLNAIVKATERSANLTSQLLAFARRQTVEPRVISLNDTVESMLVMLRQIMPENVEVNWSPDSDLWPVEMDPTQVDQMVTNLCIHARDSISGAGRILLETTNYPWNETEMEGLGLEPGPYVKLTVSDDGRGVAPEELPHLFEPFFGEGGPTQTGLGLATVYGIADQNAGRALAFSEKDKGTTIQVLLPACDVPTEPQPLQEEESQSSHGETILFVEDDDVMLGPVHAVLDSLGYAVMAARTPSEAICISESFEGHIHLLLTDVLLPEMNGTQLALTLTRQRPGLNCLFMSGYTDDIIQNPNHLPQGYGFIQKPFSVSDLASAIRKALRNHTRS